MLGGGGATGVAATMPEAVGAGSDVAEDVAEAVGAGSGVAEVAIRPFCRCFALLVTL